MSTALRLHADNLRALRELRGISLSFLSVAVGIPEQDLQKIEQGRVLSAAVVATLADFYKLDINCLTSDSSLDVSEDVNESGSIFFFQGASAALYREDLPKLNRIAQRARLFVGATELGRAGLNKRHRFEPQPVASDQPGSAARQGYRLARHVRTTLNLGVDPLPDLGGLLSGSLGVLVAEERLTDGNYQACAVLDRERSAAAILLSSALPNRDQRTLLQRVYLAHELCHLLFDVTPKGSIAISTDSEREGIRDAVEQRARAFAAELLIPRDGLTERLGEPHLRPADRAINLVEQVRHTFGAPWKVAVNHLKNMGYIDEDTRITLECDKHRRPPAPFWTAESAAAPIIELRAVQADQAPTPDQLAEQVWSRARKASREFANELDAECEATLETISEHLTSGRHEHAKMALLTALDGALRSSSIGLVTRLLARYNVNAGPPGAITGALMVTRPAKDLLGDAREEYLRRAKRALADHHGWHVERIEAALQRLS